MVRQENSYSCGAACVRQLLLDCGIDEPEERVRALSGFVENKGTWESGLVAALRELDNGQRYAGGSVDPDDHARLFMRTPFIALLNRPTGWHWVIVDEVTDEVVRLRDPWGIPDVDVNCGFEGTMKRADFDELWEHAFRRAVYRN